VLITIFFYNILGIILYPMNALCIVFFIGKKKIKKPIKSRKPEK